MSIKKQQQINVVASGGIVETCLYQLGGCGFLPHISWEFSWGALLIPHTGTETQFHRFLEKSQTWLFDTHQIHKNTPTTTKIQTDQKKIIFLNHFPSQTPGNV